MVFTHNSIRSGSYVHAVGMLRVLFHAPSGARLLVLDPVPERLAFRHKCCTIAPWCRGLTLPMRLAPGYSFLSSDDLIDSKILPDDAVFPESSEQNPGPLPAPTLPLPALEACTSLLEGVTPRHPLGSPSWTASGVHTDTTVKPPAQRRRPGGDSGAPIGRTAQGTMAAGFSFGETQPPADAVQPPVLPARVGQTSTGAGYNPAAAVSSRAAAVRKASVSKRGSVFQMTMPDNLDADEEGGMDGLRKSLRAYQENTQKLNTGGTDRPKASRLPPLASTPEGGPSRPDEPRQRRSGTAGPAQGRPARPGVDSQEANPLAAARAGGGSSATTTAGGVHGTPSSDFEYGASRRSGTVTSTAPSSTGAFVGPHSHQDAGQEEHDVGVPRATAQAPGGGVQVSSPLRGIHFDFEPQRGTRQRSGSDPSATAASRRRDLAAPTPLDPPRAPTASGKGGMGRGVGRAKAMKRGDNPMMLPSSQRSRTQSAAVGGSRNRSPPSSPGGGGGSRPQGHQHSQRQNPSDGIPVAMPISESEALEGPHHSAAAPSNGGSGGPDIEMPSRSHTMSPSGVTPDTVLLQRIVSSHVLNATALGAAALYDEEMPALGESVPLEDAGLSVTPPLYIRHAIRGAGLDALNDAIIVDPKWQWPLCGAIFSLGLVVAILLAAVAQIEVPISYIVAGVAVLVSLGVAAWAECKPEAAFPKFLHGLAQNAVQNEEVLHALHMADDNPELRIQVQSVGRLALLSGYALPVRPATEGHLVVLPSMFAPGRPTTILADRVMAKRVEAENPWCLTHRGPCLCAFSCCAHVSMWMCVCCCAACALGAS